MWKFLTMCSTTRYHQLRYPEHGKRAIDAHDSGADDRDDDGDGGAVAVVHVARRRNVVVQRDRLVLSLQSDFALRCDWILRDDRNQNSSRRYFVPNSQRNVGEGPRAHLRRNRLLPFAAQ